MAADVEAGPVFLAEAELRDLARHVKKHIPKSTEHDDEINKLLELVDRVLSVSSVSSLSVVHRVAAWNALCALTDQISAAPDLRVRDLLWTKNLWTRLLELYLQQSHNARPKSSKQLLGSLTEVLQQSKHDERADLAVQGLCNELVLSLCATEVHSDSKAKLLLLKHLLSKGIITLQDLERSHAHINDASGHDLPFDSHIETLLFRILQWTSRGDLGSLVAQLATVVLDKAKSSVLTNQPEIADTSVSTSGPLWAGPLSQALANDRENALPYEAHIFPVLFSRSLADYAAFLGTLGLHGNQSSGDQNSARTLDEHVLFTALKSGKALGLVEVVDQKAVTITADCVHLPMSLVAELASSDSRSARLAGLSLLVTSRSVTKPMTTSALRCLRRALPHLHIDTDAECRSELYSVVQQLLDRLRASSAVRARGLEHVDQRSDTARPLQPSQAFLTWYIRFLVGELRPTASYQSHISALKCISMLLRSGLDSGVRRRHWSKSAMGNTRWPFHMNIFSDGIERMLLDLLMDSFDDVRHAAAAILELHYTTRAAANMLPVALPRATKMMLASGRADHADGVALMHALDYSLAISLDTGLDPMAHLLAMAEVVLQDASSDLKKAVSGYPLHGILTSLRYVLLRQSDSAKNPPHLPQLSAILHQVWKLVAPTLCEDAPEGHTTDEGDETADVSSKVLLSYCWRALKEASLLLGVLLPLAWQDVKIRHNLRSLCFTQLAQLRHRGAFSTVAQTWATCCSLTGAAFGETGLQDWYQRTFHLLKSSHAINTRRSAGLPSLLCGIIAALPASQLLDGAVTDLDSIARQPLRADSLQEGSLVQVHAMNCMKDVIKHTKLAEQSARHVPTAFRLAADSIQSPAWAIRNCGLMLFRAVIDRLLGTNDAYISDTTSASRLLDFNQHADLLDLVMGLLKSGESEAASGRTEGVFPALQLLQRARVPSERHAEVRGAVFGLTRDVSWHIRDKAARTFISLVPAAERITTLQTLLDASFQGYNELHGRLLCAKHMLRRLRVHRCPGASGPANPELDEDFRQATDALLKAAGQDLGGTCPFTVAAVEELWNGCKRPWTLFLPEIKAAGKPDPMAALRARSLNIASLETLPLQEALERFHNATDADEWVGKRAGFLATQITLDHWTLDEFISAITEWVGACQTALRDDSIYTREAVVNSLGRLSLCWSTLWWHPKITRPLVQSLCLLIYDLTNDDNEDIRISAAETAVVVLMSCGVHSTTRGLVPLVAGEQLVRMMARTWPTAPELAQVAVSRAFGVSISGTASVASRLQGALGQSTDLFAEEKQNLYIDEAREIKVWSRVLMQMHPKAMSEILLKQLCTWLSDGANALLTHFGQFGDGPLGDSTRPEVFCLGLQVLCGLEVLLHMAEGGVRLLPVRPSRLRELLVKLLAVGIKTEWNCIWLSELQRIAERAAVVRVKNITRLVQSVQQSSSVP